MIKDVIVRFWRWLVEPPPAILEPERRHNARLLMALLVTLLPLGLVITLIPPLFVSPELVWRDRDFIALAGSVVFWVVIYRLARAGRDKLAARLSMVVGSAAIFAMALGDDNPWKIGFLIILVLLSSLLLSVRATLLLVAGHTVVILLLPVFSNDIALADIIVGPLSFMGIATTVILLSARHRDRLEVIRRAELARSESRYRNLFETTFEGIAIYGDGILLDANPGLARMLRYPLSEIVGMSLCDLIEEESRDLVARHVEAGDGQPYETHGLRKDGTSVKLELIARPHVIDGRTVRVIAARDVTERLQMERALQRSVDELQNLQHITETLLGLGELSQVMNAVAEGIVTRLGFDMVLVSRYVEEENAFTGLALHPIPMSGQFERFLKRIGRPELKSAPAEFRVPYQRGENSFVDRVLDGEVVISDSMSDLFHPWVSRSASRFAQGIFHLQAFIDLPMQVKGETVGTIVAGVRKDSISADQRKH